MAAWKKRPTTASPTWHSAILAANAALSNAVFEVKRQQSTGDGQARRYIPAATRNVFLKYYACRPAATSFQGRRRQNAYLREIKKTGRIPAMTDNPHDHTARGDGTLTSLAQLFSRSHQWHTSANHRIPLFQRDYAQGRKNEQARHVRERFIADLCAALDAMARPQAWTSSLATW